MRFDASPSDGAESSKKMSNRLPGPHTILVNRVACSARWSMGSDLNKLLGPLKLAIADKALANESDRSLIDRFITSHDEDAFAVLLTRHAAAVFGVCRRHLGEHHSAEDAFQAVFIILAKSARTIRKKDSIAGWLFTVARRVACQASRMQRREVAEFRRAVPEILKAYHATSMPQAAWSELEDELERLPANLRAPLLIRYLEGRTEKETARQLGWPLITLRRRLQKGRELLERRLTKLGATWPVVLLACGDEVVAGGPTAPPLLRIRTLKAVRAVQEGSAVPPQVAVLVRAGLHWSGEMARKGLTVFLAVSLALAGVGFLWGSGGPVAGKPRTAEVLQALPNNGVAVKGAIQKEAIAPDPGLRLSPEVAGTLKSNGDQLDSVALEWTRKRTSESTKLFFETMGWKEANNTDFFSPIRATHIWQQGKALSVVDTQSAASSSSQAKRPPVPQSWRLEQAFDGEVYTQGQGVEQARARGQLPSLLVKSMPRLGEQDPDLALMQAGAFYYSELGMYTPLAVKDFLSSPQPESWALWLRRNGAVLSGVTEDEIDGARVLKLELKTTAESSTRVVDEWSHVDAQNGTICFYLDPARGYAVRRRTETGSDGVVAVISDASDFVPVRDRKVWLPRSVVVRYSRFLRKGAGDRELLRETYSLTKAQPEVLPSDAFRLSYDRAPGSLVTTDVLPGGKAIKGQISYAIPENASEIGTVIRQAYEERFPSESRRWVLLALAGCVAILLGAGIWTYRWRRRRAQTPT